MVAEKQKVPYIVVIQYRPLEDVPPVMSIMVALQRLGRPFCYIGSYSETTRRFCEEYHIGHTLIPWPRWVYRTPQTMNKSLGKLYRALSFLPKRMYALYLLWQLKRRYGDVVVWGQALVSIAILGNLGMRLFPRRIITRFELYDAYGANWIGFDLKKAMHSSVMVECEKNRARIAQEYYGLKERPMVIPNKPIFHPRTRNMPVPDFVQRVLDQIGDRPIFLYQGIWGKSRMDVAVILETIAKHRPNYCVLSMPATPEIEARFAPYPNAFTLPRIPAPGHLAVTSHATVGVAVYRLPPEGYDQRPYNLEILNEAYCAPNKIYEYAGFGVPTLGNKVPGLKDSVEAAGAGLCVDITEGAILSAADRLVKEIESYRAKAIAFYEQTDTVRQVFDVLSVDYLL